MNSAMENLQCLLLVVVGLFLAASPAAAQVSNFLYFFLLLARLFISKRKFNHAPLKTNFRFATICTFHRNTIIGA